MYSTDGVSIEKIRELLHNNKYGDDLDIVPDFAVLPRHKYDNIQRALSEYRNQEVVTRSMPAYYHIGLTDHCNLRCRLCPTGKMDRTESRGFIDFEFYTGLVDQIAQYGIVLWLTGWGEPTLHPKLASCIRYAADRGLYTYIASNFSLEYDDDFFLGLIDSGLTRLHLDLDGMTQESYSKYRIGGSIDLVKKNIDRLIRANGTNKLSVEIAMISMRHNEHEITDFQNFCHERSISLCRLGRLQINPNIALDWLPKNPDLRYNNYLEADSPSADCPRLYFNMTLRWDGGVPPCCLAYGRINDIGNARQDCLADIWNNEMFQSARGAFAGQTNSHRTLCHLCRNNLGSHNAPHYQDTFAVTLPGT